MYHQEPGWKRRKSQARSQRKPSLRAPTPGQPGQGTSYEYQNRYLDLSDTIFVNQTKPCTKIETAMLPRPTCRSPITTICWWCASGTRKGTTSGITRLLRGRASTSRSSMSAFASTPSTTQLSNQNSDVNLGGIVVCEPQSSDLP